MRGFPALGTKGDAQPRARTATARSRLLAAMFAAACALVLAGCETLDSLNPFSEDDEAKPTPLTDFTEEARIHERWDEQVGDGAGDAYLRLGPAVSGPRVYAADGYGNVAAYERETGKRVWHVTVHDTAPPPGWRDRMAFWAARDAAFVTGAVGAGAGGVYLGTQDGDVIALDDLDGHELWRAKVSSEVAVAPESNGDIVAVATLDGKLVALDRATGAHRWTYDTQVPVLTLRGAARPLFVEGVVIASFPNGRVVALRAKGGEPVWEHRIAVPQGRSELDRIVDVDGTPVLGTGALFAASYQGRLKALRLGDGNPAWERELSTYQSLATGTGLVYAVGKDDAVLAVDEHTGETTWHSEAYLHRALTGGAVVGGYVVFGDAEGYLHVLAQSDGRTVARTRIDSDGLRADFVVADNVLYGLSNGGRLFALDIQAK